MANTGHGEEGEICLLCRGPGTPQACHLVEGGHEEGGEEGGLQAPLHYFLQERWGSLLHPQVFTWLEYSMWLNGTFIIGRPLCTFAILIYFFNALMPKFISMFNFLN